MALITRDDMEHHYFEPDGELFRPLSLAKSDWNPQQMHGVAVSGLLARGAEHALAGLGRSDMSPARFHVDLFRPAAMAPTSVEATVLRNGRRIVLIDSVLRQDGEQVARATASFLQTAQAQTGTVWSSDDRATPPDQDLPPESEPMVASENPWSVGFAGHQNAGRHATWQTAIPAVRGDEPSPYQAIAQLADITNLICNWGSAGVEFINTDVSLALVRRPDSTSVGVRATDRLEHEGIAVGTAELFDRSGPLGTATVTAVVNTLRTIDLT
ncbi:thioesterase family protein [Gordonia sp. VNK21]|uniref:thioesterase family protein n=1 Tax=Gordonia sp. VNK21 TaxID=3382483 RepID=UPI0038D3B269